MSENIVDLVSRVSKKLPRFRTQAGVRIKLADAWYVRYWDWDEKGSAIERKRVREFLAPLTVTDEDELDLLQRSLMRGVNARQKLDYHPPDPKQMTVDQFFSTTFLPMIEQNRARGTAETYTSLWRIYCKDHFKNQPLVSYKTVDANKFLADVATKQHDRVQGLSQHSLNAVRTVCSHTFSYALNLGLIDRNPISEVRLFVRVRKAPKTYIYSDDEVAGILALPIKTKAKLLFALVSLNGLRPAEAAALKWSDISGDLLSIERAAPSGRLGPTKTEDSVQVVPIVAAVADFLRAHRKECERRAAKRKESVSEFIFPGRANECMDARVYAYHRIGKAAIAAGLTWKGIYAGRRHAGSVIVNRVSSVAGTGVLRNSKGVLEQHYFEAELEQARKGTQAIQQGYSQALARRKAQSRSKRKA